MMTAKAKKHIEYSVEKELTEEFEKILGSVPKFIPLKDKLTFAACFLIRMDDDGQSLPGKGKVVTIKKVAPDFQVFMRPKAHFVIIVDYHWWNKCNERERTGTVVKTLTRVRLEDDENGVKVGLNGWDIEETFASLETSGVYNETTSRVKEIMDKVRNRMLDVAAGGAAKITKAAAAAAKAEAEPEPEPEPEPDEEEKPRVVARPLPPKPAAKKKTDDEAPEPTRPPRKIPADPAPQPADEEPEPEDE